MMICRSSLTILSQQKCSVKKGITAAFERLHLAHLMMVPRVQVLKWTVQ